MYSMANFAAHTALFQNTQLETRGGEILPHPYYLKIIALGTHKV